MGRRQEARQLNSGWLDLNGIHCFNYIGKSVNSGRKESPVNNDGVLQMKYSTTPKGVVWLFLTFFLFISTAAFAGNPLITASFSGIWDQPEQESQGLIIQIGESNGEKVGIAYWFTYGEDL